MRLILPAFLRPVICMNSRQSSRCAFSRASQGSKCFCKSSYWLSYVKITPKLGRNKNTYSSSGLQLPSKKLGTKGGLFRQEGRWSLQLDLPGEAHDGVGMLLGIVGKRPPSQTRSIYSASSDTEERYGRGRRKDVLGKTLLYAWFLIVLQGCPGLFHGCIYGFVGLSIVKPMVFLEVFSSEDVPSCMHFFCYKASPSWKRLQYPFFLGGV